MTLLLWSTLVIAATVHVPGDYATIQTALDSISAGDTVLVALGTYGEALVAPPFSFVLKGDVTPDTGDYPRPVIDPSGLPLPNTRCCLTLHGGHPVIEDFRFYNGPAMRQSRPWDSAVGVDTDERDGLTIRRCVFDSVWCAIGSGNVPLKLEDCWFRGDTTWCIRNSEGAVRANGCVFDSPGSWNIELVAAGDSSEFINCQFRNAFQRCGYLMFLSAPYFRIAGCVFGPGNPERTMMLIGNVHRAYIEDNTFTDLDFGLGENLMRIGTDQQDTLFIRRNRFVGNTGSPYFHVGTGDTVRSFCAVIDSNQFVDCSVTLPEGAPAAFSAGNRVVARWNRFVRLTGPGPAILLSRDSASVLAGNYFHNTGWALQTYQGMSATDARWNWWGDRTGPCDTISNPHALGDTVTGLVDYVPWISDTNLLEQKSPSAFLADGLNLDVFPNPFNSETRISYELERTGKVEMVVYDLEGRAVRILCDEVKAAGRQEVTFEGEGLSSGTYFVRLQAGEMIRVQKITLLK